MVLRVISINYNIINVNPSGKVSRFNFKKYNRLAEQKSRKRIYFRT